MVVVYLVTHALAHTPVSKLTFTQLRSYMTLILLLWLPRYMQLAEKANPKFAFSAATFSSKKFFKKAHTQQLCSCRHRAHSISGRHQENGVNNQTHGFQSRLPSYALSFLLLFKLRLQMVFTVTSSNCKVKIARFYEFLFPLG